MPNATIQTTIATVPVHIVFADLPEASQNFIAEYGLRQYIQDGAAVEVHVKDDDGEFVRDADGKKVKRPADDVTADKRAGVEARLANLASGEFTRRSTKAPVDPAERERLAIIRADVAAWAKAAGKSLPTRTGKKANPELADKIEAAWYAKHKESIDKRIAKRLAEMAKVDLGDLTDIEAMLG
jgi:hypothetical protein